MQLHNLKKNRANKRKTRVGRGGAKGKTSGRGTKGQNARAGRKKRPEMRDIIKRIPKLRGRGKNSLKSRHLDKVVISLASLERNFSNGDVVSSSSLLEKKIISTISGKVPSVKILATGELKKKLTIKGLDVSSGSSKAIVALGGNIEK